MPRYFALNKYSSTGLAGVIKEGFAAREATARAAFESVGGTLEYWSWLGLAEWDFALIVDAPDYGTIQRVMAAGGSSGAFTRGLIYEVLTGDEMDAAMAGPLSWRPPGAA